MMITHILQVLKSSNMAVYSGRMSLKYISDLSCPKVVKSLLRRQQGPRRLNNFYSSESRGVPLNEPLPDVGVKPRVSLSPPASGGGVYETRITTLENGVKVASEESFGQFSTVGGVWRELASSLQAASIEHCLLNPQ